MYNLFDIFFPKEYLVFLYMKYTKKINNEIKPSKKRQLDRLWS